MYPTTRIALTGAAGKLGRELLDAVDDADDLLPLTYSEHADAAEVLEE